MEFLVEIFNTILYQPLFNTLVLLYEFLPGHDFGIAVIVLTILIRLALSPSMIQSLKSQKVLSGLQPKIQEIQNKYKKDKEKQAQEIMELYQKEKINPLGGCLPLLAQLPILIALYRVFQRGFQPGTLSYLYGFVPKPEVIDPSFLGILDLSKSFIIELNDHIEYYWPVAILAILAGVVQFFQTKMMTPKTKKIQQRREISTQIAEQISKQMLYFFPFFTVFILLRVPAAVGLYWAVSILFTMLQQYLINKPKPPTSL